MICWAFVGKAVAVYFVAKLICFTCTFLRSFVFPIFGFGIDLKSYGTWAVVTGATDGIGKGYAKQLARKGLNVVLISRSQEKLDAVAEEITEAYDVEIKTIAFDFGAVDGYEAIENELKDMNIGILVNNVGTNFEHPEFFTSVKIEVMEKILNVNMLSAIKMTHMILPGMVARKKGILIHVASASAYKPVPLLSVYSASKAFVDFLARSIQVEYKDKGIISQSVLPMFVATNMAKMRPSLTVPHPESYARQALETVGVSDRTNGYWTHFLQSMFVGFLPTSAIMKNMKKIRAKYLKRKAKSE
eukprot:gene16745-18439_t